MKRAWRITAGAAAALGGIGLLESPASAHHPEVEASNVCVAGIPAISVTATAWETDLGDDRRVNSNVRIDATGPRTNQSLSGVFVSPDYNAQVVFEVPGSIGDTLTVRATAVAPWGPNGEYGFAGTWRETTVTVADVCPPSQEDSSAIETRPPQAELPAVTEAAPAPPPLPAGPESVQVMGASVTRVPAQVPATELAFTGDHTHTLTAIAVAMLAAGATAVGWSRRSLVRRRAYRPLP